MLLRNQWAHLCGRFQWRSQPQTLSFLLERPDESVKNSALDVDALGAEADLASIQEYCVGDSGAGILKITIREDDGGILSAQFKRYWLHGRGDCLHDGSTSLRLACERNRIHIRMLGE